ncbi:MAG: hypothetical protein M1461_01845 [Nitrospirae bacterium]|nr:hypothetical protein [Nitrospirota bacterium]
MREWKEVLRETAHASFEELFPRMESRYVPPDDPGPSIGTMELADMPYIFCDYYKPDHPRPRIRITDTKGIIKDRIPITDLAFGSLFHYALKKAKDDCEKALRTIREELKSKKIYLRLGLARPYGNIPEPYKGWCALQVNGFHTFPDLYDRDYGEWIRSD